ncbi:hypothetical protein TrLO_g8739 [Triparma laevis f. longispina]|uniref:Uncharacterized protein n=1 Tax=Triparma laevis f. longispina TaxID=1714387 RepID=A0A9W6ZVW3_9STRA|nr:hypothetical protein TrLO_g8739 [Triparma laevis f. longispina]
MSTQSSSLHATSTPSSPVSPTDPVDPNDPELKILRQIRGSFLAILRMVESMRSDLSLLGERFDRLYENSERARGLVKEKIRREREGREREEREKESEKKREKKRKAPST